MLARSKNNNNILYYSRRQTATIDACNITQWTSFDTQAETPNTTKQHTSLYKVCLARALDSVPALESWRPPGGPLRDPSPGGYLPARPHIGPSPGPHSCIYPPPPSPLPPPKKYNCEALYLIFKRKLQCIFIHSFHCAHSWNEKFKY